MISLDFERLSDETVAAAEVPYANRPIPCQADDRCLFAVRSFTDVGDEERVEILRALTSRSCRLLKCFAVRMAALAVRETDTEKAYFALIAGALSLTHIDDKRDAIVIFAPVYDSIKRTGLRPDEAFRDAAALVPPAAAFLESFVKRKPRDRSLKAMGFVTSKDEGGFCYKRQP
jgi:hypothetical protein